jgi:hypothetical protein
MQDSSNPISDVSFYESQIIHMFWDWECLDYYFVIPPSIHEGKDKKSHTHSTSIFYVIECKNVYNLNIEAVPRGISRLEFLQKDQQTQIMSIFDLNQNLNQNFRSEKGWITVEAEKFNLVNLGVFDWLTYKLSDIPFLIEKLDRPTGLDMQQ